MEEISFEGFIYDCSENSIRMIYCSVIGEVCIDETTEVISRSRKPAVGMWCTFKASCQEDGKWFTRMVVLMPCPRLKCVMRENECIVKGTAIVCNINGDSGYLWNDYIGLIAIEGQMVYQLKPLICVQFQAVPLKKNGTPAYFMAKEVSIELESIFQSEILLFTQKAKIKTDGQAYVSDCIITLLDIAYSDQLTAPATMSILYYKTYSDSAFGVGIYATTDSNIVAGIKDGFFTTKRCFETCAEQREIELFEDALENLTVTSNKLPAIDDEMPIIKIDISPTEDMIEFAEDKKNDHSSKVVNPLADDCNSLTNQSSESCLVNFCISDSDDKLSSSAFAQEEMVDKTSSSEDSIPAELKKEFMKLNEEDIWDNEFIEHLQHKIKEVKHTQNSTENNKEEYDELKDYAEQRPTSVRRHAQNIEATKTTAKWVDEMDKLCIKVLSNARLRNFVSVNKNGNALLRDIMHYLEYQMTMEDVNEKLGIPLSEVTSECFNIVHEERALEICRKLMKMNGFERVANSKIPKIPKEIG
ncbi:unnamed protein product [Acanthocheilonema viteae]|uniref:Uncharacterized protein n=1 Tax=Acanthocheilonema viteae TaxID=6277 RepID=A0A498SRQ9_ACAVI|nr:unnamed protein product [Acanthocheilonema viteae]